MFKKYVFNSFVILTAFFTLPLEATTLKISHQFPASANNNEGDFRDRLVKKFAEEVKKKTNGSLDFEIYPDSSLMKTNSQFSAMRKGALDLSLVPISYSGGELPEVNIGLMPAIVTSYAQAYKWRNAPVGKEFTRFLNEKGIIMVCWIWQAGGTASRGQPIVNPSDASGFKIRGGSREIDLILKDAGAAVVSIPSNEIYSSMQTGAIDAAMTSSTSLISFRLEEVSKSLTAPRDFAWWIMLEPLLMSKAVFDTLTKEQQDAILSVGEDLEKFAQESSKADDARVAQVYEKAGAKVVFLTEEDVLRWQDIARKTAWKDYAAKTPISAKLLQLAEQVK